jgi:hypothetical protein
MTQVLITEKFYKKALDSVNFVYNKLPDIDNFLLDKKDIESRPQCLDWRSDAMARFHDFLVCINLGKVGTNCQFLEKHVKAFNVKIAGTQQATASLFYDKESVKNYDPTSRKSVVVSAIVPITCSQGLLTVQNGESVKISLENGKVCLRSS